MHASALTRKIRKEREIITAFAALIDTPGNLVTGVTMPAGADIYASRATAIVAVTAVATVKGSNGSTIATLHLPPIASGVARRIGSVREDLVVFKSVGLAGTLSLYVRNGLGTLFKIAEG